MRKGLLYTLLMYSGYTTVLCAQAFQNLDFESATVSNLPAGDSEFVSVTDALPGWTAYIGTNQLTQVGHNYITLGDANVGIWGPDYGFGLPPLQGSYTAILQAGAFQGDGLGASIAQTGLIPATAKSIQFEGALQLGSVGATFTNTFVFTVGGQNMSAIPLGGDLYGCDISAFTGSVQNISFTMDDNFGNALMFLDAITFSPEDIPEPSCLSLVLIGVACLAFWQVAHRRLA
jgi:hypothetical protein